MRILLTNHALNHYYGTESWTYAMAKELAKHHEVDVFTIHRGLMSEKISQFAQIIDKPVCEYDLALVNHWSCLEKIERPVPSIFTSHSIQLGLEDTPLQPVDKLVAVSEEIAAKRKIQHVIRNPIDCERFKPRQPIRKNLERVLYLSHPHYADGYDLVAEACRGLKLEMIIKETFRTDLLIQNADLVIGFGRGLMEAMACGRNVISADFRPKYMQHFAGGGMVTAENFDSLKRDNFTGRTSNQRKFTAQSLRAEIEKYDSVNGEWLRQKILQEFNVKSIAAQYLELHGRA